MKMLRTIRLDASDSFVYETAAKAGEWAVAGAFEFWATDPANLQGRDRQAFRAGFFGLSSCGWSTLVVAVSITAEERAGAVESLAAHLMRAHGAPDLDAARAAAHEEIAAASGLAEHPDGTLIALHRSLDADGNIREQFRTLHPAASREAAQMPCSAGAFAIVEDEATRSDDGGDDDVSLLDLAGGRAETTAKRLAP